MLEIIKAIIYGIVEGITEWLPISSTGHLILVERLIPFQETSEGFFDMFDVVIQLGAILAVVVLFWNKIWPFYMKKNQQTKKGGIVRSKKDFTVGNVALSMDAFWMWVKIVVACIPAVVYGLLFDDAVSEAFKKEIGTSGVTVQVIVVAVMLVLVGVLFIVIENWRASKREEMAVAGSFGSRAVVSGGRPAGAHFAAPPTATAEDEDDDENLDFGSIATLEDLSWKTALGIGCFQVLSLVPGTSRSGSTIIGGLLLGCTRSVASKFTFFLAIPVMFGASALKLVKYFIKGGTFGTNEIAILGVGCVVAFVVSLIAIKWLMGFVRRHDFKCFGVYRIILGIVVLAYFFVLEPMLGL